MNEITYDLSRGDYYEEIEEFAQEVIAKAEQDHSKIITEYMQFIKREKLEELRSREEYIFDYLLLGVLANLYLNNVLETSRTTYVFMHKLIDFKDKYDKLTGIIDLLQGFLNTTLLYSAQREDYSYEFINKNDLAELIQWLAATGEYQEEIRRFKNWEEYFAAQFSVKVSYDLKYALNFAHWFQNRGVERLGNYTKNVKKFRQGEQSKHLWRQDILLRTKPEEEYHLNMLGAEIINKARRREFLAAEKKVVLAPSCMRKKSAAECRAEEKRLGLQCLHCERDCNINLIDSLGSQGSFEVVIINDDYDFNYYFKQWRAQKKVGLIVITCALKLLLVQYQLQRFNIPSQSLLLDYCGCQRHWSQEGSITNIDLDKLLVKLQKNPGDKFIQMNIYDNQEERRE